MTRNRNVTKVGPSHPGAIGLVGALSEIASPPAWADDALCAQVDPELWYPEKGGSTAYAKRICFRCPVTAECLEYALARNERYGIWGGKSERERRRLRGVA